MSDLIDRVEQTLSRMKAVPTSYGEARANSVPYHELSQIFIELAEVYIEDHHDSYNESRHRYA